MGFEPKVSENRRKCIRIEHPAWPLRRIKPVLLVLGGAALSGSPMPPDVGRKGPRWTWASDRLFRSSFPCLRVEDEGDAAIANAAISFQNSELVLHISFAAGLERYVSATRWRDGCEGQLRRFARPEMEEENFLFESVVTH